MVVYWGLVVLCVLLDIIIGYCVDEMENVVVCYDDFVFIVFGDGLNMCKIFSYKIVIQYMGQVGFKVVKMYDVCVSLVWFVLFMIVYVKCF